jgi:DNA-binding MarR family transcriptional regulator
MGFLDHQRSRVDRRSVRIKVTDRAARCATSIRSTRSMCTQYGQVGGIRADEFEVLNKTLHRLECFWTDQILYRLQESEATAWDCAEPDETILDRDSGHVISGKVNIDGSRSILYLCTRRR